MGRGSGLRAAFATQLRDYELDVEVDVPRGRCLGLVGPSGAGKSTVLRTIAGLHSPDRGRVRLDGETWLDTGEGVELDPDRRRVGYLFQDYALFPHLSAWRNVAFALGHLPRAERRERSLPYLERLGVAGLADSQPSRLSGGERQRVALARALAREPELLLLDEPLAALDSRTAAATARELAAVLTETGVASVLVTHDFAQAALLADEIAVIDRGRIVQRAAPGELSARPASAFVADFAGAAVLFGVARPGRDGTTTVVLDGGGRLRSSDHAVGPVAAAIYPWEISIEPAGSESRGSALNRLDVEVSSVTEVGNRVRVGLLAPQPLGAELTASSVERLGLAPGTKAVATFKATATRLVGR